MNYGLPYMGSKNRIAKWVLENLPEKENFYDLFCGGCAITHCAIENKKYKNYFINDIKGEMPEGFLNAVKGGFKNENRWISHEEFDRLKGKGDIYVDICFSFGNNCKTYAYSKKNEEIKKAAHYAIFFKDYSLMDEIGIDVRSIEIGETNRDKYLLLKKIVKNYIGRFDLQSLERLQNLQRLQSLERLQSLQLENLQRLVRLQNIKGNDLINSSSKSYDEIEIKKNSVIYCDIPYRGTAKYSKEGFDYDKFYKWALSQKEPIFISEYNMPDDFICIAEKEKKCSFSSSSNSTKSIEKIFIPKHQLKII